MNITMAASECAPFFKTGGLADVIGSLPKALAKKKHSLTVFLPKHRSLPDDIDRQLVFEGSFDVFVKWRKQYCGLYSLQSEQVTYYFIDNQYYFNRNSLYGEYDDAERYIYFTHAIFQSLDYLNLEPDLIHCHDWQTGLIPAYIKAGAYPKPIKTIFTIHNLRYQGIFPLSIFDELIHLDSYHLGGVEMNGAINFMKSALIHSDWLTTVSETYAEEVQSSYYGEGLDQLLKQRSHELAGIVNGIDDELFDPLSDPTLPTNYSNDPLCKEQNKLAIQEELHLELNPKKPMLVLISRLVEEKGLHLFTHIIDRLMHENIQLVVMGTGDSQFEEQFHSFSQRYPDHFRFLCTFNESTARRLYAASTFFLMPSRFEPCGLSQLIALRYETVPIVRETGGLKDTIQPYNEFEGTGNGFSFLNYNADDFYNVIRYAISIYNNPDHRNTLLANIYQTKLNWQHSASKYEELYKKVTLGNEGNLHDDDRPDISSTAYREATLVLR
ncbi:glycogen synthase [Bacillus suaedae]|uniref:Glycogen synthase n=1 Tax=Halalkalibacter suaedae TaxID=2822140 RepID=A0A941APH5_9BACI|nr:glycogen/starch synthase [Bacillus suaedae]MBP3951492.1 glycogen synthase [Bacillus suaedae]